MQIEALCKQLEEGQSSLSNIQGKADARLDAIDSVKYQIDGNKLVNLDEVRIAKSNDIGLGIQLHGCSGQAFAAEEGEFSWQRTLEKARETSLPHKPPIDRAGFTDNKIQLSVSEFEPPEPEWFLNLHACLRQKYKHLELQRLFFSGKRGWRGVVRTDGRAFLRDMHDLQISAIFTIKNKSSKEWSAAFSAGESIDKLSLEQQLYNQLDEADNLWSTFSKAIYKEHIGPVILDPAVSGFLIHEALGHPSEADRWPNDHPFRQSIGIDSQVRIGAEILNVTDHGDYPEMRGGLPWDDEGIECEPNRLVRDGRWVSMLHSQQTATADNAIAKGNARTTSFRYPTLCRMRVMAIHAGESDPLKILGESDNALYLTWPQEGHVPNGNVEIRAFAWRLMRGGLHEPLGPVVLQGSAFSILREIETIGNDNLQINGHPGCGRHGQSGLLPVGMITPTVRLARAKVLPI